MDYILYGAIFLGLVLVLIIIFKPKKEKDGHKASQILKELGDSDPDKNKYVLSDITFHDGIRESHIDHLLINSFGLHVVLEVKQDGDIEGKANDDKWIAHHKGYEDPFDNPLLIAKSIKLSIDKVLKEDYPIYLYIVFPDRADLKVRRMSIPVIKSYELNDSIKDNEKPGKPLSKETTKKIHDLFAKL